MYRDCWVVLLPTQDFINITVGFLAYLAKRCTGMAQRSRVRIPYKPEFFSAFLFATAKVAYITAMISLHI